MNNLTLAVLLGACSPILSMDSGILMKQQPVAKNESATITISNKTPDCIEVLVKYFNREELIPLRIEPNEEVAITEAAHQIEKLYAVRYGKYLKWTNLSQLTLGLVAPHNIMNESLLRHLVGHNANSEVIIKRGNKLVEALTNDNRLRWAAGLVSPYEYEVSCANRRFPSKQNLFSDLFSFFPRVQRAKEAEQAIYPRYFLNLPEDAESHAVWEAYKIAKAYWKSYKEQSTDPESMRLAVQALVFAKASWKSLSRGGQYTDAFNKLVLSEIDAPTAYLFEKAPLTPQQIADWAEMGGTFEPDDNSTSDPKSDGTNNNNNNNNESN